MRLIQFFLLCAFVHGALAEPIPPHLGEWAFSDYFSYYRTAGNYVNSGTSSADLPNGGYFQTMNDTLSVNWDAMKEVRVDANITYGTSQAVTNGITTTGQGFSEAYAGAQYWYRTRNTPWFPRGTSAFHFIESTTRRRPTL